MHHATRTLIGAMLLIPISGCSQPAPAVVTPNDSAPVIAITDPAPEATSGPADESFQATAAQGASAGTIAGKTAPAPAPDATAYRPDWWFEPGERTDAVAAMADDNNLRAATREAATEGIESLSRLLGGPPTSRVTRTESVRLPDGTYRAFFFVAAGEGS